MVSQTWKAFTNKLLTFNYSFLDYIPLNVLHWCLTGPGGVHAEIVVMKIVHSLFIKLSSIRISVYSIQLLFVVFLIIAWLYCNF